MVAQCAEENSPTCTRIDSIMDAMVAAIAKVKSSQGSIVSLPKAELDLLAHIERARDFMIEALSNQSDRSRLRENFGGDCSRIAQLRAVCERIEFSDMNKGDQRLPTCLRACESVEKVIIDLGDGEALRRAQSSIRAAIEASGGGLAWGASTLALEAGSDAHPAVSGQCVDHSALPTSSTPYGADASATAAAVERTAEMVLTLTRADAQRLEEKLWDEMARLEERLKKVVSGREDSFRECIAACESTLQSRVLSLEEQQAASRQEFSQSVSGLKQDHDRCQSDTKRLEDRLGSMTSHADLERMCRQIAEESQSRTCCVEAKLNDLVDALGSKLDKSQEMLCAVMQENKRLVEERCITIERRVERLEERCNEIELQAQERDRAAETAVACLNGQVSAIENRLQEFSQECKSALETAQCSLDRRASHAEERLGDFESAVQRLADQIANGDQRVSEMLEAKVKNEEMLQTAKLQLDERHEVLRAELMSECRSACADKFEQLQEDMSSVTKRSEVLSQDVERVKKTMDLDPLWNSFAHVGSLVGALQKRVDELSIFQSQFERDGQASWP